MNKQAVYQQVALLHANNINQGFLSSLGVDFLVLLYQAIDEDQFSSLIFAVENEQVVGFVTGTLGMKSVYRQLFRYWPRLLPALIPSLVRPRRIWRIIEILRYSRGNKQNNLNLPSAELLSIVIDPAFRGHHYSGSLYQQLKDFFVHHGENEFKIIVGGTLAPAHRFYRKMGAIPVAEIEVHRGVRSTVYLQKMT